PRENGGLRGYVPARPERATPRIQFVSLAPRFWIGLQTPPHDDALALLLAFGSSFTWLGDFHPDSSVPCLARTFALSGRRRRSALERGVRLRAHGPGASESGDREHAKTG